MVRSLPILFPKNNRADGSPRVALFSASSSGKEAEALPTPTYRSLAAPVSKPVDKFALLPAFLKVGIFGLLNPSNFDAFNLTLAAFTEH